MATQIQKFLKNRWNKQFKHDSLGMLASYVPSAAHLKVLLGDENVGNSGQRDRRLTGAVRRKPDGRGVCLWPPLRLHQCANAPKGA